MFDVTYFDLTFWDPTYWPLAGEPVTTFQFLEPVEIGGGAWLVRWTSPEYAGPWYVYEGGYFSTVTMLTQVLVWLGIEDRDQRIVDVFEDSVSRPDAVRGNKFILRWRDISGVVQWIIELWDNASSWDFAYSFRADGRATYVWTTEPLNDDREYRYRVYGLDSRGNATNPVEFIRSMRRNPDTPVTTITINEGVGTATIAEAT